MGEDEKLENIITTPITQEEVFKEEKPIYDDELGSEDSLVAF